MANRLDCQIQVEFRPVGVIGRRQLDLENLAHHGITKPGELGIREK